MNLYNLHSNPETLKHYGKAQEFVPELAWEKYEDQPEELKNREHLWIKDARCAYLYALDVLKGRFSEGKKTIATSPECAYLYARYVIEGKWLEGENSIATNSLYAYEYTVFVTHEPFLAGEDVIAMVARYACVYAQDILHGRFIKGEAVIAKSPYKKIYENYFVAKL